MAKAATIKEGSYFVYRDSASGITDSFYARLYNVDSFCDTYIGNSGWHIEYHIINADNVIFYFKVNSTSGSMTGYFSSYDPLSYLNLPVQPGQTLDNSTNSPFSYKMIRQYPSFTVRNNVYHDVYEMMNGNLSADKMDTSYVNTYYSTESGLIRYSLRDKAGNWQTWELERNKIIR